MIQAWIGRWILKKGLTTALLFIGDLGVSLTKSKTDDKMWKKVRPIIKKFK